MVGSGNPEARRTGQEKKRGGPEASLAGREGKGSRGARSPEWLDGKQGGPGGKCG
jgi:hypothetical protein